MKNGIAISGERIHAGVDVAVQKRDVALLAIEPQQEARCCKHAEKHRQADHQESQKQRQKEKQHGPYSTATSTLS